METLITRMKNAEIRLKESFSLLGIFRNRTSKSRDDVGLGSFIDRAQQWGEDCRVRDIALFFQEFKESN